MELVVVRHGETVENKNHIIQGQLAGHLSLTGRQQAEQVADDLSEESIDVMYSSDLARCIDTAKPIHNYHKGIALHFSPAIREMSFGEYQGQPSASLDWQSLTGNILTRKVPGGESWIDLSHRVAPFLNNVFESHRDESVLLITHGGPMRVMRSYLTRVVLEDLISQAIDNCEVWRCTMNEQVAV